MHLAKGNLVDASLALESFVKGWETCCLKPHLYHGTWMVGWSHRMRPDENIVVSITQADADAVLSDEIHACAHKVDHAIYREINQCQFDALVSVSLDIGCKAFAASMLAKRVNGGYFDEAAGQFETCPGSHERRVAEREMFQHCDYSGHA